MGDVEEILDDAWPARLDRVGAAPQLAKIRIVPLRKRRDVVRGLTPADPHEAVALDRTVGGGSRLLRWQHIRLGGDAHALAVRTIHPTVVGAAQRTTLDF